MAPTSKRIVPGIFSIISFILSTFSLYNLPTTHGILTIFYFRLAGELIFSYNIAIILAWFAFGTAGGVTITILSAIFALLLNLRIGLVGHSAFTLPFFLTALFGFACRRSGNRIDDFYRLKLEKLGEDINILSNDIADKRKGIFSVEDKLKRYAILKEVIESFSTGLLLDDITRLITEKAFRTIGKPGRILLFLVDTEKQELILSASRGPERVPAKRGDLFDRWVLKNRKPLIVEDIITDFRFSTDNHGELKKTFRSLVAVPLVSGDKVTGILRMDNIREFMYTQDDLRLLDIIASLSAVAIENAILYARTQELARKDSLTGLAVRRYFLERLQAEGKRAAIKKTSLSLLMVDIDHFKEYNDRFGHAAGDIVLKHIARTMSSMIKEGDIIARYGGEEIVVMLCGRNKKDAASEAEYIRKAVRNNPITLRRHMSSITVSIGVSSYPGDASPAEGLIRIADERLYKAKAEGRDRVCSA
ncbi:MAG: sensor domain-containing diguanylate cyclase [Candidatus Omnitrophota bacterium]|nr:sensor domain-containing diguanylate cyclase [Candidatus Omnitrophota bacterium]